MEKIIYANGTADVLVPAGQKIAIATYGNEYATLSFKRGNNLEFIQRLDNAQVTLGPWTDVRTVSIEAAQDQVLYDVGTAPNIESDVRVKTNQLTGGRGLKVDGGGIVQVIGPSAIAGDIAAATENTAKIQAALDAGGVIPVVADGVIYINQTLVYGDNTHLQASPKAVIKMLPGLRIPILKSAALGRMQAAPNSVTLSWTSGMTFSVAWPVHGRAIGDPVWLDGATLQPQYKGVFVVESVTDADNFVVRAKRMPTAVPAGSVNAVNATKNTIIQGGIWDYSFDGTGSAGLNPHAILNVGVYRVFTNGITVNNAAKYLNYWAASLNCGFNDVRSDGTNSDAVKVYGPAVGFRGDGVRGTIKDDGCSFQTREPAAYIQYQPYFGDVIDCRVKNIAVKSTTSQAVFYTGSLATGYMDECSFENIAGVSPSGLRVVNNMNAVDATPLDYSAGYLWVDGLTGDYSLVAGLEQIQLQRWRLSGFRASTSRVVSQDVITVNANFYARDSFFDLGAFDSPTVTSGGGFCINYNGGADLLTVMCGAKSFGGQPRIVQLNTASTVRQLVIEKANSDCDQLVECFAANNPTIIVRNSRVGGPALLSARNSCTLVLQGNDITNATNGVVRGSATCTVTLRTDGCNRLRAGLWVVQASGTLTLLVYGDEVALDPIASTFLGTTAGQYLSSTRAGAVNQGPSVRVAAGWVALGTGASQANTLIT